jgi:hypothetical protein
MILMASQALDFTSQFGLLKAFKSWCRALVPKDDEVYTRSFILDDSLCPFMRTDTSHFINGISIIGISQNEAFIINNSESRLCQNVIYKNLFYLLSFWHEIMPNGAILYED